MARTVTGFSLFALAVPALPTVNHPALEGGA